MATRKVPFIEGEFYHVYNRGNSKQKIFLDDEDYLRFVKCLFVCNGNKNFKFRDDIIEHKINAFDFDKGDPLVSTGAWVLMPNHFHLYLTIESFSHMSDMGERTRKNQITEFVRKLSTSYAKYFNKKYNRTGGLFEGAFKAQHIKTDNHAKYIFSYIHLNPIKLIQSDWKENGIQDLERGLEFLQNYKWSSYQDYKGIKRGESAILNSSHFPTYFSDVKDFDREILGWLNTPH